MARRLLGFDPRSDGYVIPYPGTEDERGDPFRRFKPDVPFDSGRGKPAKYLSPTKSRYAIGNRLYIPGNLAPGVLRDTSQRILITEGERKALRACQDGLPTVALAGVTCWVSTSPEGASCPIADLDLIEWPGRQVVILFDSDAATKSAVRFEEYKLYRELTSRGAKVRVGRLPRPTMEESKQYSLGGKLGLDDLLVVRGREGVERVLASTFVPRKPQQLPGAKSRPTHFRVAQEFLRDKRLQRDGLLRLRWWRKTFWRWDGRAYSDWQDADVEAFVMRYLQSRPELHECCTKYFLANVVANLQAICAIDREVQPPAWLTEERSDPGRLLCLANGVLDVNALLAGSGDVLRPHTPTLFSVNALPFDFDPDAECPLWERTLERILPNPTVRALVQQWFGYCLLPGTWLQKFLVLVGDGQNGKSVVCKALAALLGEANVSAVRIEDFRHTHALVGTLGKLANIVAEFEELDSTTEGMLKANVGGDRMEFNPKFKPTFTAYPTARLVAATNTLPRIRDKSDGVYRRMVVIRFPVTIPEDEKNPHLVEELGEELPGILNWSLVGLHDLLERGDLVEPEESASIREDHRRACNSARAFVAEELESSVGSQLPKQAVFEAYAASCRERGLEPVTEAQFAREVYRLFGDSVSSRKVRLGVERIRTNVYDGVRWAADVGAGPGGPGG
ncbi:DUF3854 domain-containing protein, partial [bacterium]|nr:DUF3854 domain-containing protein [bacterium]